MNYTIGYRLPDFFSIPLFGDRKRYGFNIQPDDPCWKEWQKTYMDYYYSSQKLYGGEIINNGGYKVITKLNMLGKRVLEIGPGDINHIKNWNGKPKYYAVIDIQQPMLDRTITKLEAKGIPYSAKLLKSGDLGKLPFDDNEFDTIILFYTLEHIYPLSPYLEQLLKVLKRGGKLVGAIPCEGGLAWGSGRFMTSRRWLKKHTSINPDKIISWEHPNFADAILRILDNYMFRRYISFWPLVIPSIDLNLIVKFIYEKP